MISKNSFRFIATFALALFAFLPSVSAQCSAEDEDIVILIIDGGSLGGDPAHHAPALIPIQAAYCPTLSAVLVDFLYDLGSVSVEIENETSGAYTQTTVNATQGVHPFVISGNTGDYTITFTLSNSHVYIGEFSIE